MTFRCRKSIKNIRVCQNAIQVCLLQRGSESNSGAISRSNLVRFIFTFRLGFILKIGKKEDILDWEWGIISDPGDREKRPCSIMLLGTKVESQKKYVPQPVKLTLDNLLGM